MFFRHVETGPVWERGYRITQISKFEFFYCGTPSLCVLKNYQLPFAPDTLVHTFLVCLILNAGKPCWDKNHEIYCPCLLKTSDISNLWSIFGNSLCKENEVKKNCSSVTAMKPVWHIRKTAFTDKVRTSFVQIKSVCLDEIF